MLLCALHLVCRHRTQETIIKVRYDEHTHTLTLSFTLALTLTLTLTLTTTYSQTQKIETTRKRERESERERERERERCVRAVGLLGLPLTTLPWDSLPTYVSAVPPHADV